MRRIINGKRYDTETATLIGEADNLCSGVDSKSDFGYWEAGLYRTKNGRFFLAGEGGPMSQFSHQVGQNSRGGGEDIIPMDAAEALEWAERHLGAEAVEKHFSDQIEDA